MFVVQSSRIMSSSLSLLRRLVRMSPEVDRAMRGSCGPMGSKVVLLESAILTHGLPYPDNLRMAGEVEDIIRQKGAIPATVGVLDGKLQVGMTGEQVGLLCGREGATTARMKVSRRDLPFALMSPAASGASGSRVGGTTVCGTLAAAGAAGWPPVFVTGGVGGVHRGGQSTMDVSADLVELGRARTAVVSAGVKSILDVGRTLEVLETQGVAVATLGADEFPAFFTRSSGYPSPHVIDSLEAAAELIRLHRTLAEAGDDCAGVLLAVPIPESASADGRAVEEAVQSALAEAEAAGVSGRDVTPFVLEQVRRRTEGKSLEANLALMRNNASVGADIAVELARQTSKHARETRHFFPPIRGGGSSPSLAHSLDKRPLVIGGSIFDLATTVRDPIAMDGSTHRGRVEFSYGGVGRNVADALACFGDDPFFVSAVGGDDLGEKILGHNPALDKGGVSVLPGAATAVYNALLDRDGEVVMGVGDMRIHARIDEDIIDAALEGVGKPSAIVLDGNLTEEALEHVLRTCSETRVPLLFEPTDVNKAKKVVGSSYLSSITYATPNLSELVSLTGSTECPADIESVAAMAATLLRHLQVVVVTMGEGGVLVVRRGSRDDPLPLHNDPDPVEDEEEMPALSARHYPSEKKKRKGGRRVTSVNGAGDCLAAAFLSAALRRRPQDCAVSAGLQAARTCMAVGKAVPHDLSADSLDWEATAEGTDVAL